MNHISSFNIVNADNYFKEMVLPQYDDFLNENSSSRYALLTIILVYHMYEWVNKEKFNENKFKAAYPNSANLAKSFDVARNITNGTKHFIYKVTTRVQPGFSSGFNNGFAKPLNIEFPNGNEVPVDIFLHELIAFWEKEKANGSF